MAWTPSDFIADIVSITEAVERGIPDRVTAERDVIEVEVQLRAATRRSARLEVAVEFAPGLTLGFGPFNGTIGLFVDNLVGREPLYQSAEFWRGYAAVPLLIAAIKVEVAAADVARVARR